jgi:hypothetical protein
VVQAPLKAASAATTNNANTRLTQHSPARESTTIRDKS